MPKEKKIPRLSGFIIIRLAARVRLAKREDPGKLKNLKAVLDQHEIVPQRLISSVTPEKLLAMEKKAAASEFPPLYSLTSYWRLDGRKLKPKALRELLKKLQELSEVDLAYLEKIVLNPAVDSTNDALASRQNYLDAAPVGIDARWAWTQPNGDGAGVGFIDLEQGWLLNHEDLIEKTPTLIFNDNRDIDQDHGTAVLGVVVGVDNCVGIVGVAPGVSSVRVVSHYNAPYDTDLHVADAIAAALDVMAPGDVLLLEVQRDFLPTETDDVDFNAIRLASALG